MRLDVYEALYMTDKTIGVNYSKVARENNCDRRTVKRYFNNKDNQPNVRKKRIIKKVTDPYKDIIENKFINASANAKSIYDFLKSRHGYKGSYSSIKRICKTLKDEKQSEANIRFETSKGLQMQIDWKENMTLHNKEGTLYTVNFFLAILGYSRLKYVELTLDKTQPTLFRCITNAFKYIGGVPKELLFDNMKTVIDRSRSQFGSPVFNQRFVQFAKDAGFIPRSCMAFRPQTKGKVETVAKIVNRLKVYDYEFVNLEELESITKQFLFEINDEIQQTTHERPFDRVLKEKEYFNSEPNYDALADYFRPGQVARKVDKSSFVQYKLKKYSVPMKYVGKSVTIIEEDDHISIYYNNKFVNSHKLSDQYINYNEEDYSEIIRKTLQNSDNIDEFCKNNLKLFDDL